MSQVEKETKETRQRTRERESYLAALGQEKVAGRIVSKRKSGNTATEIFKSNGGRSKGRY